MCISVQPVHRQWDISEKDLFNSPSKPLFCFIIYIYNIVALQKIIFQSVD